MDKNTYTLTVDDKTFAKMKDFYQDDCVENNNPNLDFFARNNNCSISGYKSNKVVFQGSKAKYEVSIWDQNIDDEEETLIGYDCFGNHAGSDEVGTGDFFGPIIVVAAYVKQSQFDELVSLGVKDSKKLSDEKILEIGKKLIKTVTYSHLHLDNEKFNQMTDKGFNMNKLKAYLHNQALLNLQKKLGRKKIEYIVVDQFAPEKLYYSYLKDQILVQKDIKFVTKGESHSIAVACASIIARYSFLLKMEKLSKAVGCTLPKGAGEDVDIVAAKLYKKMKKDDFDKICKVNFKNYDKLSK